LLLALGLSTCLPKNKSINIPRIETCGRRRQILPVTIGLTLISGIITGLLPALRSSRQKPYQSMMKEPEFAGGPVVESGICWVVAEVALALFCWPAAG